MPGLRAKKFGRRRFSKCLAWIKSFLSSSRSLHESPASSSYELSHNQSHVKASDPSPFSASLPADSPSQNCGADESSLSNVSRASNLYQEDVERVHPPLGFNGAASTSWNVLRQTLSITNEISEVFPPLRAALSGLLAIMNCIESVNGVQTDFAELLARMVALNRRLKRYQTREAELPATVSMRLHDLSSALEGQIKVIQKQMRRGLVQRILGVPKDSQEIIRAFRELAALIDDFTFDTNLNIDINVEEIRSELGQFRKAVRERRHSQVNPTDTLLPVRSALCDPEGYPEEYKGCLPGTCKDSLSTAMDTLRLALSYGDHRLWLTGVAGSGKSTLSTSLVSALRAEGVTVATFFCKRDQADRRDPRRIIPTIVWYLASMIPEFCSSLGPTLVDIREGRRALPSHPADQLDTLLLRPLRALAELYPSRESHSFSLKSSPIVLFIDALDESDDVSRHLFVDALMDDSVTFPIGVTVVLVSRKVRDLQRKLQSIPILLDLDQHLHDPSMEHDIRLYLENRLRGIREQQEEESEWPSEFEVSSLTKRADGLFIWAVIACNFIEQPSCRQELSRLLRTNVVVGIDDLYAHTLGSEFSKMHGKDAWVEDYRMVTGCIICSISPLSPTDIAFLIDRPLNVVNATLNILQPLLYRDDQDYVRLVHASLADYLLDETRSQQLWVAHTYLHLALARGCLNALVQFSDERLSSSIKPRMSPSEEFLHVSYVPSHVRYSSASWASHLLLAQIDDNELPLIAGIVEKFLLSSFLTWVEILSVLGTIANGLHLLGLLCTWTQQWKVSFQDLALDSRLFLETFRVPIQEGAAHIYISALPWAPSASLIARNYLKKLDPDRVRLPSVLSGLPSEWPLDNTLDNSVLEIKTMRDEDSNGSLIFSPDGSLVAHAQDKELRVWDTHNGHLIFGPLRHNSKIVALTFSSDNQHIASSVMQPARVSDDGDDSVLEIVVFSIITTATVSCISLQLPESKPMVKEVQANAHMVFTEDGNLLAHAVNQLLCVWDVRTGLLICGPLHHTSNIVAVEFSSDNQYIASSILHAKCTDGNDEYFPLDIAVFCIDDCNQSPIFIHTVKVRTVEALSRMKFMAFSEDNLHLHMVPDYFNPGEEMELWDFATGDCVDSSSEDFLSRLSLQAKGVTFEHATGWLLKENWDSESDIYSFVPYYGWDKKFLLSHLSCPTAVNSSSVVVLVFDLEPIIIQFPSYWDRGELITSSISDSVSSNTGTEFSWRERSEDGHSLAITQTGNLEVHEEELRRAEEPIFKRFTSMLTHMQYTELIESFQIHYEDYFRSIIASSVIQYMHEDPLGWPYIYIDAVKLPPHTCVHVAPYKQGETGERLKFAFIPCRLPKEATGTRHFILLGQRGFWYLRLE